MVLDPIPQSLPLHFFGSRPQPPTSPCNTPVFMHAYMYEYHTQHACIHHAHMHVWIGEFHVIHLLLILGAAPHCNTHMYTSGTKKKSILRLHCICLYMYMWLNTCLFTCRLNMYYIHIMYIYSVHSHIHLYYIHVGRIYTHIHIFILHIRYIYTHIYTAQIHITYTWGTCVHTYTLDVYIVYTCTCACINIYYIHERYVCTHDCSSTYSFACV